MAGAPRWLTLEAIAAEPAWSLADTLALPGRCRGALLKDWAAHVTRRAGPGAVSALREALGLDARALPDAPPREAWYPVGYQLALTRAIVDRSLGGDVLALEPLLMEDAGRVRDKVAAVTMRLMGARRLFGKTSEVHGWLYDLGAARAEVADHRARVVLSGARYFAEPTFRALQLFATRALLRGLGKTLVDLRADAAPDDGLVIEAAWR